MQLALAARGASPGYLSAFPEEFFDRVEARKGVWAPYYTLHKILAGLLDVHRVFGDPTALEAAKGMAAWVGLRAARLDDAQWQEMLETEFGGMQESLTELYARDRRSRAPAPRAPVRPPRRLRPARARRGPARRPAREHPDPQGDRRGARLRADRRAALLPGRGDLLEQGRAGRSYAIGGHSEDEHFFPVAHFSRHLGESTAETCNTYNMLKLSRGLFLRDGDAARLDFYERGLFNHILASNDPATGVVSYYVSMKCGRLAHLLDARGLVLVLRGDRHGEPGALRRGDLRPPRRRALVSLFLASELAGARRACACARRRASPIRSGRA